MIDIDSFKKLNDEKGHLYGDQILFEIGKNLSKYNSANSIAARYGGDEFLLLFTAADNKKLRVLKSELKCLFNHQIIVDGKKEMIRVSLGSASYPKDEKTLNELIFKADKNLYSVKRKHNN